jgi:hypothetical protein
LGKEEGEPVMRREKNSPLPRSHAKIGSISFTSSLLYERENLSYDRECSSFQRES